MVKPIRDGFHSITPHLIITGGAQAVEWYKKVFGAQVNALTPMPNGKLMHAELKIGDSILMLADCFPEMGQKSPKDVGTSTVVLNLSVPDCDKVWQKALAEGATVRFPMDDMFWGDRYGQLVDPFGHLWGILTHKEDVPPAELDKRAKAAMAQMGGKPS